MAVDDGVTVLLSPQNFDAVLINDGVILPMALKLVRIYNPPVEDVKSSSPASSKNRPSVELYIVFKT